MSRLNLVLAGALSLLPIASAAQEGQTPASALPSAEPQRPPLAWDTVSIHQAKEDDDGNQDTSDQPNGILWRRVHVFDLLGSAYEFQVAGARPEDVIGLPQWARDQRYDIMAHVAPEDAATYKKLTDVPLTETIKAAVEHRPTPDMLMVRSLLEDRFHLKLHYERRERTVYALTVDKGGPKLKQAEDLNHGDMHGDNKEIVAHGVPALFLAGMLSPYVDRETIDRTGLTGNYDFTLKFHLGDEAQKADDNSPDLFTALREQLGLRLESTKADVLVLVIDHIDPPTAN